MAAPSTEPYPIHCPNSANTFVPTPVASSSDDHPAPIVVYGHGGLNLLRCLTDRRVPTFYLTPDANDYALHSRYVTAGRVIADARSNPDETLDALVSFSLELCGNYARKPALFFGDDATLTLISRQRDRLKLYYRFNLPDARTVESLVDKAAFAGLAAEHRLPVPKTVRSSEVADISGLLDLLSLPCILKPSRHTGWFGSEAIAREGGQPQKMLRANTKEELERMYVRMRQFTDDFVVQEYVPGDDSCIYSFHAYSNESATPLAFYVGRKIRTYPKDSGVSTFIELVKEPAVVQLGLQVLRTLKLAGPVKMDFKRDRARGRYCLLEVNPRFNLWNYLGAACGINLLRIAYADLEDEPVALPADYRTGVRWLSFADDLRAFLRSYHPAGELTWRDWLRSLRGPKVYDCFAWNDPLPLITFLRRDIQRWVRNQIGRATSVGL